MLRYTAILTIALSGVVHLLIVPEHFSHGDVHVGFFIFIGVAQLMWAVAFWWHSSGILYRAGLALSGGTIILWALTRLVSVPLAPEVQAINTFLIVSKSAELIGFFALLAWSWRGLGLGPAYGLWPVSRSIAGALVVAVVFGTGAWGGGQLVEMVSPGLGHASSHGAGLEQDGGPGHIEGQESHPGDYEGHDPHIQQASK